MARSPAWMDDIALRVGDGVAAISVEAAGALLAQLANSAPDAVLEALAAVPRSEETVESRAIGRQLDELVALLGGHDRDGAPVAYEPKPAARHLRFRQQPFEGPYMESELMPGTRPMVFAFEAEELDGTHWGVQTLFEREGSAIAQAVLPMITERKPLNWVKDEVEKLKRGEGSP